MRMFVSGPRVAGFRFGAIVHRRDLATMYPWHFWRLPIAFALGVGIVLAGVLGADFVHYLPR